MAPARFVVRSVAFVSCRVMAARTELLGWRQQVVQMALPERAVGLVLVDVAERLRGLDDRLDASPEP